LNEHVGLAGHQSGLGGLLAQGVQALVEPLHVSVIQVLHHLTSGSEVRRRLFPGSFHDEVSREYIHLPPGQASTGRMAYLSAVMQTLSE
jgi:hypothetical protein